MKVVLSKKIIYEKNATPGLRDVLGLLMIGIPTDKLFGDRTFYLLDSATITIACNFFFILYTGFA